MKFRPTVLITVYVLCYSLFPGCTGGSHPSLRFIPGMDGTPEVREHDMDAYVREIVRSGNDRAAALLDEGYSLADSLGADALLSFSNALADRLDGVNAPFRNEERFALALDREVRCRSLEPADFRRITFRRERLRRNAPGHTLENIPVVTPEEDTLLLRDLVKGRKTLLFLYGESCTSCRILSRQLAAGKELAALRQRGELQCIALYAGDRPSEQAAMQEALPDWTAVRDLSAIRYDGAFDQRMIPSLYLVSESGIVRLRGERSLPAVLRAIREDRSSSLRIPLEPDEYVWGGRIADGRAMPYADGFSTTLYENSGNQVTPLLLTSAGRYVWSESPFTFRLEGRTLVIENARSDIETARVAGDLAGAYRFAMQAFFPARGKTPPEAFFHLPQYNTWIELQYKQNQAGVLAYARGILSHGLPPGILMIDDSWMEDYGIWDFHPGRFPSPASMCDQLHRMGFTVMLWVTPFVSLDQYALWSEINSFDGFLRNPEGHVYPIEWWNGISGELDLTNPAAADWLERRLRNLMDSYGIDGFKFDAGDFPFYPEDAITHLPSTPWEQCQRFSALGERFPYNEFRTAWKDGGKPLVQRLHDKSHNWDAVKVLLPEMMAANLMGYWFSCPDMIGGGSFTSFLPGCVLDQDLFVRSAQIHALMPMMQFSAAPWRVLDPEHLQAVLEAVRIRSSLQGEIDTLVKAAALTGEPVVAPLEYVFPHEGLAAVRDEYMLGRHLLVAPMLDSGTTRTVVLPRGNWVSDDGTLYAGGQCVTVEVPLNRIPYFRTTLKTMPADE